MQLLPRAVAVATAVLGFAVAAGPAVAAAAPAAVPAACEPGGSGCYPPPDQPTTTTSASTVQAKEPLTVCGEHYQPDSTVQITDDGRPVTTVTTGATGKGCTRIQWESPIAKAHEVGPASSALGNEGGLRGSGVLAGARLAWPAAAQRTQCHDVGTSGPDADGRPASSSVTVCVEPRDSSAQGNGKQGNGKQMASSTPLRATGLDALGVLAVGLAASALAVGAARGRRRSRHPAR